MAIKREEGYNKLVKVNLYLRTDYPVSSSGSLIDESKVMKNLRDMMKKVAVVETSVLIRGENGTGKAASSSSESGV